tara:strand:- start:70 stop:285 length:216 start_codon:yes stop_codon:yes gene_type:complete
MAEVASFAFTTPKPLKMSAHPYIYVATPYGHLPPPQSQKALSLATSFKQTKEMLPESFLRSRTWKSFESER